MSLLALVDKDSSAQFHVGLSQEAWSTILAKWYMISAGLHFQFHWISGWFRFLSLILRPKLFSHNTLGASCWLKLGPLTLFFPPQLCLTLTLVGTNLRILWLTCSAGPFLKWQWANHCILGMFELDWNHSSTTAACSIHCSSLLVHFFMKACRATHSHHTFCRFELLLPHCNLGFKEKTPFALLCWGLSLCFFQGSSSHYKSLLGPRNLLPSFSSSLHCYSPVSELQISERLICCCTPLHYLPIKVNFGRFSPWLIDKMQKQHNERPGWRTTVYIDSQEAANSLKSRIICFF